MQGLLIQAYKALIWNSWSLCFVSNSSSTSFSFAALIPVPIKIYWLNVCSLLPLFNWINKKGGIGLCRHKVKLKAKILFDIHRKIVYNIIPREERDGWFLVNIWFCISGKPPCSMAYYRIWEWALYVYVLKQP